MKLLITENLTIMTSHHENMSTGSSKSGVMVVRVAILSGIYSECRVLCNLTPSVIMLNVVMPNVAAPFCRA
jgi:hypothetical protein